MTTLRDAARQALEALEYIRSTTVWQADKHAANPAITALRAALAQEEQEQESGGVCARCGGWVCDPVVAQQEQDMGEGETARRREKERLMSGIL